jgi:hypothetical protein
MTKIRNFKKPVRPPRVTDVFLSNQGTGYNLRYGRQSKNALTYGMQKRYAYLAKGLLLDAEIQHNINRLAAGAIPPGKKLAKHCSQETKAMIKFIGALQDDKKKHNEKKKKTHPTSNKKK